MKYIHILFFLVVFSLPVSAQTYEDMVNSAMDLIEAEDYLAAEEALKATIKKDPSNMNNPMLIVNLGTVQRNLGKLNEALISYSIVAEKYPDNAFIRHNRAALYCELDRFDEAMKDYNAILLNNENDTEALYRRGLIYLSKKNILAAEEDFEKILQFKPENLYGKMGKASIMKRRSEWEDAEELYNDLIYKYKENADLYFHRAECYMELNKLGKANDDINKALDLGFIDASLYILKGKLRLAQYEKRYAKEDFLKAKEMGADSAYIDELLMLCK